MSELEQKQKLAEMMLFEADPFKAAMAVFNQDVSKALTATQIWLKDPEFLKIQQETKREKGKEYLPTKHDLARDVWEKMQAKWVEPDDYAKLAKLYAEINGFIEKGPTVAINTNLTTNKVMIVKQFQSADAWEEKAVIQQQALTNNASTRH